MFCFISFSTEFRGSSVVASALHGAYPARTTTKRTWGDSTLALGLVLVRVKPLMFMISGLVKSDRCKLKLKNPTQEDSDDDEGSQDHYDGGAGVPPATKPSKKRRAPDGDPGASSSKGAVP
jgi:hypothetical protein